MPLGQPIPLLDSPEGCGPSLSSHPQHADHYFSCRNRTTSPPLGSSKPSADGQPATASGFNPLSTRLSFLCMQVFQFPPQVPHHEPPLDPLPPLENKHHFEKYVEMKEAHKTNYDPHTHTLSSLGQKTRHRERGGPSHMVSQQIPAAFNVLSAWISVPGDPLSYITLSCV